MVLSNIAQQAIEIQDYFSFAKSIDASVCIYRLPEINMVALMMDENPLRIQRNDFMPEEHSGFVFSPFKETENTPTFIIKKEFYSEWKYEADAWVNTYTSHETANIKKHKSNTKKAVETVTLTAETPKTEFENLVANAIDNMAHTGLKKVVLAGKEEYAAALEGKEFALFEQLIQRYPHAFCYVVYSPLCGTWMGASPEILVKRTAQNVFHTVSLAGTKVYKAEQSMAQTLWSQKEIEEHAYVSRYIVDCFKKIRLREFTESGPKTVRAGHLLHLKTEFSVDLTDTGFEYLTGTMLKLLHPTAAVCGTPLDLALEFIENNEFFTREYFTGFLGPVNASAYPTQEIHIFVNIRCMHWQVDHATLYAGAGITEDSQPAHEFQEIKNKIFTIKSLLFP